MNLKHRFIKPKPRRKSSNVHATYQAALKSAPSEIVADLVYGTAHEIEVAAFVEVLKETIEPQTPSWYSYVAYVREAQEAIANGLRSMRAIDVAPDNIFMTTGTGHSLAVLFRLVCTDEAEEIVVIEPYWFGYQPQIEAAGGQPVVVPLDGDTFALNVERIRAAITERTVAVVINSPHNPTGRVFSEEELSQLAEMLLAESEALGRPIYIISDETFMRVTYSTQLALSPCVYYPYTFIAYGYSKQLLAGGQRIGYIALGPDFPAAEEVRPLINSDLAVVNGWSFPSALMQRALPAFDSLCINLNELREKRDWFVLELGKLGYEVVLPEGAYFLLVKCKGDDLEFAISLISRGVSVLPGSTMGIPGYVRVSLTATRSMLQFALDSGFKVE